MQERGPSGITSSLVSAGTPHAILQECFVLVSKILERSVDGDDIQEFASRMFSAALQAGIAVGEAGLALYLSPATLGGVLVLALAALYAYDAVSITPRSRIARFTSDTYLSPGSVRQPTQRRPIRQRPFLQ